MSAQAAGRRQSTVGLQMELQQIRLIVEPFAAHRIRDLIYRRKTSFPKPQNETTARYFTIATTVLEVLLRSRRKMNGYELFVEIKESIDPLLTESAMLKLLPSISRSLRFEHKAATRQICGRP